jgi:CRP/FNR family transcriptional regulator, cyclic AMP receptor protein
MTVDAPAIDLRAGSLFDVDSELAELLDARQLADARVRAIVPVAELPAGEWPGADLQRATAQPFALMVLDGILLRELLLAGSTATELLGPGDIVAFTDADDALLPAAARWSVPDTARIMVLDDRLLAILRAWPGVGRVLLSRAVKRERRLATHRAIAQLPRVDLRLLTFFGHLAERWGRVAPTGVVIPLHLTHETLGRLIGARRPTVSLALKDLAADNRLERRRDGAWLLHYEALQSLGADDVVPSGWHPAEARSVVTPEQDLAAAAAAEVPLGAAEIAALRARIDELRKEHESRVARTADVISRSRSVRQDDSGGRRGREAA